MEENNKQSTDASTAETVRKLQASSLAPAKMSPSSDLKASTVSAVFVGETPVILTGPADCEASMGVAQRLVDAKEFRRVAQIAYGAGDITASVAQGQDIMWPAECLAIAASTPGELEAGSESANEVLLIELIGNMPLVTHLCTQTPLARILDPACPELAKS